MSTKRPREPRKPLDQSFLDFVHGSEPEDPSAAAKLEPEVTPASQLEHQLMELRDRFTELERASFNRDNHRFSQFEDQLTQLTQKVEQVEMHVQPQIAQLQHRLGEVEQISADWNTRYLSQVEDQLTQLTQKVEQMNQITNQPLTMELQQRFDALAKTLLEQETQHFSQIDRRLTDLTQKVEQLEAHFQQLLAELRGRPLEVESTSSSQAANYASPVADQLVQQIQPAEQPEVKSQPSTKPVEAAAHGSESDSLLSRIGPLLDDF